MIKGGLISAKIKFKAWNRQEGGWNPSLFFYYTFIFSFFLKDKGIFDVKDYLEQLPIH